MYEHQRYIQTQNIAPPVEFKNLDCKAAYQAGVVPLYFGGVMTEPEKQDYCKDGLCTAEQHSDCVNFQPVHDLDFCRHCGIGWTCDFEVEDER